VWLAGGRGGGRGCSQNGQWSARLVAQRRAIPQRAREASRGATYAGECGEASEGGQVLIYPIIISVRFLGADSLLAYRVIVTRNFHLFSVTNT
jgi:hypothetical protein